jgi:hypothetical protein
MYSSRIYPMSSRDSNCCSYGVFVARLLYNIWRFTWVRTHMQVNVTLDHRFVLGAVSPAICVPCMTSLTLRRLGTEQGIPTLVIAASSIDDLVAITGFACIISVLFAEGCYCAVETLNVLLLLQVLSYSFFSKCYSNYSLALVMVL